MGLANLLGGGIVEGITSAATGITKTITDYKSQKIDAKVALAQLEQKLPEFQNQINLAEAANPSIFISGWRPACGWVCVSGLAYEYLLRPLINGILDSRQFTSLDISTLLGLLVPLLGLAGYRTFEKAKGVARS